MVAQEEFKYVSGLDPNTPTLIGSYDLKTTKILLNKEEVEKLRS